MKFTYQEKAIISASKERLEMGEYSVAVLWPHQICFYRKDYPDSIVCHYSLRNNGKWIFYKDSSSGIDQSDLFRIVHFMGDVISLGFDAKKLKECLEEI